MSLPTVGTAANNNCHTGEARVKRLAGQCCMLYNTMTPPVLMSIRPPLRPDNPHSLNSGIKPSRMKNRGYR